MVNIINPQNVDIHYRWAATQQEINVYLNNTLVALKNSYEKFSCEIESLTSEHTQFINQNVLDISKLKISIKDLEDLLAKYNNNQISFESDTNFKLDLYNTSINDLSVSLSKATVDIEKLKNDFIDFKTTVDFDKISELINSYNNVFKLFEESFNKIEKELNFKYDSLTLETNNKLTEINNKFDEFKNILIQDQQVYYNNINTIVGDQSETLTAFYNEFRNKYKCFYDEYSEELIRIESESKNRDSFITQVFNDKYVELNKLIEKNRVELIELLDAAVVKLDEMDNNILVELRSLNDRINVIEQSDSRQWDTLNNILEAQNKINEEHAIFHIEHAKIRENIKKIEREMEEIRVQHNNDMLALTNHITAMVDPAYANLSFDSKQIVPIQNEGEEFLFTFEEFKLSIKQPTQTSEFGSINFELDLDHYCYITLNDKMTLQKGNFSVVFKLVEGEIENGLYIEAKIFNSLANNIKPSTLYLDFDPKRKLISINVYKSVELDYAIK